MVDMSPEAITARLREMATLSREPPPAGVDMSSEAITARLQELAELSAFCLQLAEIGKSAR